MILLCSEEKGKKVGLTSYKKSFQSPVVLSPTLKLVHPRSSWLNGDVLPIVKDSSVEKDVALPQPLLLLKVVGAAEVGSA